MTDQETIARFVLMRSQGWSFNRIATELNVSKPTLIKWSRERKYDIQNLRATETEVLAERVFGQRQRRWEALARQLSKIEEEIEKRDPKEIPASRLHGIAAALRAEIQREVGSLEFSETTTGMPKDEFLYGARTWHG